MWVYVGWLVLLLGARLSFYVQNPSYLRLGLVELQLSAAETEDLALRIMYLVTLAYTHSGSRWRTDALAAQLRVPGIAVSRTAARLEAAGLLTTDESERWLPGRDPGHVSLREILHAARDPRRSVGDTHGALRIPAVDRLREELQRASDTVCDETKLRDWVKLAYRGHSPAMVISSINSEPMRIPPRRSTSEPIATMSRYIFLRLPAMVISWTGCTIAPSSTQKTVAPRE